MEAYTLDICGRETGSLLQNKTFIPLDGPIFSVSSSSNEKTVSFVHAAWNKAGSKFVAGDCNGNVYMFLLDKNRFSLIGRLKICSSFVTFSNDKSQDVLVALSDCSIKSLNSDSKVVKNQFNLHTSCVVYISFNKSGQTVLSCCKDQAILWDLRSFAVQRVLTLKTDVDIIKVFFLPDKDIIVSAFNDNSVFFWNNRTFSCINQFLCVSGDEYLNIKTIDASRDEKLLACAGKTNWFIVWSISEQKRVNTVALPDTVSFIKQLSFLPNSNDNHLLSVLASDGEVYIMNLKSMEFLYKLTSQTGKIISIINSINLFQMLTISIQGAMNLYDVEPVLVDENTDNDNRPTRKATSDRENKIEIMKKTKIKKKESPDLDKRLLQSVIKNYEEYPEKHRFFIWTRMLELPHNVDAFNVLHQESLTVKPFVKDYSFMNPGVQKTFLRLMSMIVCWYPVIQEIEYFQCVVFPFIKVLHKNTIMCFELLITLISNWCQNWFLFSPFPPFNILCVVENILSFHDKELMAHFIKQKISAEVYAWSLLKTSFSEVLNKKQWLKLWDNMLSNPLSFQLYSVAAFNIVMRDILLRCNTLEQFKGCYRKHGISAEVLLKKAYNLQKSSPTDIDPEPVIGRFSPVPKGAYPSFFQLSQMKIDLETVTRKKILDQEIHYLKQREDNLEIRSNYLKELQELQMLRRKLVLESVELKNVNSLEKLDTKLRAVQNLIQENLKDQISMLKGTLGEDIFSEGSEDAQMRYFQFQDFVKKLRKNNK